jgi:membrane protein YqaA with SNARE-associated domain
MFQMHWFEKWGPWAIFLGCFAPLAPYKIFTIGAGALQLDFLSFIFSSILGRTGRFLLIAVIIRLGGPKVEPILRKILAK